MLVFGCEDVVDVCVTEVVVGELIRVVDLLVREVVEVADELEEVDVVGTLLVEEVVTFSVEKVGVVEVVAPEDPPIRPVPKATPRMISIGITATRLITINLCLLN
jgi:hypothetical protein